MRQIISNNNGEDLIETFETEDPDIGPFNRVMLDKGFENVKSFQVDSKGYIIETDLLNGRIILDGQEVDLQLDDETKLKLKDNLCKWINFRRNTISLRMDGLKSRKTKYGVGFQALIDGKNIKRYLLVDNDESVLIKE